MVQDIVATLNPRQRAAVELAPVNALILAGAGSGKTKVLTTRIAWLMARGAARPYEILAVTFTNKAAREMRTRLEAMVPIDISQMWMGTFHGLAHRLLRLHNVEANLPKTFQIIDQSDQLSLIKRIMKDAGIDPEARDPRSVQAMINTFKEKGLRSAAVQADETDTAGHTIYAAYEGRCQREGLVDFAELLLRSVELLERNELVREHYARRFKFILVDEFQDTNALQFRWIRALSDPAGAGNSVFCVGDDDQSIYAFRGALVGNMARFVKEYGVREVIKLEQNYRSTGHILDAANAVIANNAERMGKNLWTDQGKGDRIELYNAQGDREEARQIVQDILTRSRCGENYRSFAILYRNNSQSRVLEQYLNANSIPYRIYGGLRFFDRAEVKDVTAYLRVMSNPDDTSLMRVINHPPRGIGATTVERVAAIAATRQCSMWEVISDPEVDPMVRRAGGFVLLVERLKEACEGLGLAEAVQKVIEVSGLKAHYEAQRDADIRLENLSEIVNAAKGYCEENGIDEENAAFDVMDGGTMSPVDGFLSQATLEADDKNDDAGSRDEVQMMTVHASKGLEFDNVYLTGLEENLFPHSTRNADDDRAAEKALSEERRLMYVAMTRARKRLRISWCAERMLYGRTNSNPRSRFIDEIPAEHLHELNPVVDKAPGSAWSGARYGSGASGYGRGGYSGGGYGSGYGSSGYGGGYGSRGTGSAPSWQRPPSGEGARRLDSDGWRRAGVRPASEYAVRQTSSGLGSLKKKSEVPNAYGLSVGDMVEHKVFGRGRVEKILYPEKADQTKLFIKFASGTKELLAQFAAAGMHKIES